MVRVAAHFTSMNGVTGFSSWVLAAVDMGYGHLRAALALADHLGLAVSRVDRPPLADASEARLWARFRHAYERLSRASQRPVVGPPFRWVLDRVTAIAPIGAERSESRPGMAARRVDHLISRGLGAGLARHLDDTGEALLTTFYAPALAVDRLCDAPVHCVVTDTDIHRVWAPLHGPRSRIRYLVPAPCTGERLRSYGVRPENIVVTGFPLPPALEHRAETNLERRVERLAGIRCSGVRDADRVPLLTFAVGGAGAQAERGRQLLRALKQPLRAGAMRLALVAGMRPRLGARFRQWCVSEIGEEWRRAVEVLEADSFEPYYRRFNSLLERTDVLWTKPSELVFYSALGLPLILDDPVGAHEQANARWVVDNGAGLVSPVPAKIWPDLEKWLAEGALADCARSGFTNLPRGGANTIRDECSIPLNKDLTAG